MDGFTPPYWMDRNTNGGGIELSLYVREDTPSRQISFKSDDKDIELISYSYNPHLQFIDKHRERIG